MKIDHAAARRIADGWASSRVKFPPVGDLARAYLDLLARLPAEEPHHRHLAEMRSGR